MRSLIDMGRPFVLCAVLAALLVSSGCSASAGSEAVRQAAPAQFAAEAGTRILINVHTPDEGSIRGTNMTVPFDQLRARAAELPSDHAAPLAIYCMTGGMSAIAGDTLAGLGYFDIVELRGGMRAWEADGRLLDPARA